MELVLERGLEHQQKAIDAITRVFDSIEFEQSQYSYQNPKLRVYPRDLKSTIREVQKNVMPEHWGSTQYEGYLNLDIKMETGTGKTYVYTKAIYEMYYKYGLNKFVIVVPTLPIKAGTRQFMEDVYAKKHFADDYGAEIELLTVEALKKKKGKQHFPSVVRDFVNGSNRNTRKIYVLLLNSHLLTNAKLLTTGYDYSVEGHYQPLKAIAATKPIVIIDEPHRFSKGQKAFGEIVSKIKPQCIIRFGATYPETTIGRGKNKQVIKDYHNLIYELDACDSFNQNLIKGVAKEHFQPLSDKEEKIKIVSVKKGVSVTFHYKKSGEATKVVTLGVGDPLSLVTEALEGVTVTGIKTSTVEFSNGLEKNQGEELDVDIYMTSYQEQMVKLALLRHFETERINYAVNKLRVKTLALFFIDDIYSYRQKDGDDKKPYLKELFEKNLKEMLEQEIAKCAPEEASYKEYLEASLQNISECHAGYFAQDNSDSDEEIAKEVNDILHNKKQLLAFENPDGTYNVRRFLFSKWTLKEGWDNPNVFTITKLRSSGSDNSKLQEVGRGLRLPVDENGNRISNEQFYLNYIVDFTEADFAEKLVAQINGERPAAINLTDELVKTVAAKRKVDPNTLFGELFNGGFIDFTKKIVPEKRSEFLEKYPEFADGVKEGKIKDRNSETAKDIKIRPAKYDEIKKLWEAVNQNYIITYDSELDDGLLDEVSKILINNSIFSTTTYSSKRDVITTDGKSAVVSEGSNVEFTVENPLPYGEFLQRINKATSIPVKVIHNAVVEYSKKKGNIDKATISERAVGNFVRKFNEWKLDNLQGRFSYKRCNTYNKKTALSNADGSPKKVIASGRIGTKILAGEASAKYLYDTIAFDSPLEKQNVLAGDIEEIIVYGKIPRRSIAIPTIAGGTYSPDFMYVVKKTNGEKELNIIVETKDVENKTDLRGIEQVKIDCASKFFEQLTNDGFKVSFHTQIKNKQIKEIIESVLHA